VGCLILCVYYFWRADLHLSADDRLTMLVKRESRGESQPPQSKQPGLMAFVVPRLSEGLKPKSGIEQQALRLKLARAGCNTPHAVELFLCLKMMCLLAAGVAGGIAGSIYLGRQQCLMAAGFVACLAFYLPDLVLRSLTKRRQE